MSVYVITVRGCDDTTEVIMDLSDRDADAVSVVADAITKASTYGCQPRMYIEHAPGLVVDGELVGAAEIEATL